LLTIICWLPFPSIIVGQIVEQLGTTANYLSATFRKKMGLTFVSYLTEIRMLRAKKLLSDPVLQIQQVAEAVVYYNTRYFAKLFIQFAGCTPSEYRKMTVK
jgi:two-component system response regulator YesN